MGDKYTKYTSKITSKYAAISELGIKRPTETLNTQRHTPPTLPTQWQGQLKTFWNFIDHKMEYWANKPKETEHDNVQIEIFIIP